LGGVVIGIEQRSGGQLPVAEFFESGLHGASMFATDVYPAGFSFSGGGHNVFESLAKDVNGAVDLVDVVPAKVVVHCCPAAGPGLDKVGGVRGNFENHVAGMISDDGIGVRM
jgi:hypothetical protein